MALVELACVAIGVGLYWELYLRPECYCVEREWGADWSYPPGCRRPADAPEPLDEGEKVSVTLKREFTEEAGSHLDQRSKARFDELVAQLFTKGELVYCGCE